MLIQKSFYRKGIETRKKQEIREKIGLKVAI